MSKLLPFLMALGAARQSTWGAKPHRGVARVSDEKKQWLEKKHEQRRKDKANKKRSRKGKRK